jgi:cellobiose-specific phosphotransferase system component IIC
MLTTKQTETENTEQESHTGQRFVGIIFGIIEIMLTFRLIFKLLGANAANSFVHGLYSASQFFIGAFEGIFSRVNTGGGATITVFEPATLIAMVVVALLAWVVLKLMTPRNGTRVARTENTERADQEK